jgi:hypothetical protein
MEQLNIATGKQYQKEEQSVIFRRIQLAEARVKRLITCMGEDRISTPEKVEELRAGLADHYRNKSFLRCERMGELLQTSLDIIEANVRRYRKQLETTFEDDI